MLCCVSYGFLFTHQSRTVGSEYILDFHLEVEVVSCEDLLAGLKMCFFESYYLLKKFAQKLANQFGLLQLWYLV